MATPCKHLKGASRPPANTAGCEECLAMGDRWVHLRLCLACGHVGCCDSSPNKHATAHFRKTGHPAVSSLEPGEAWAFCYADDVFVEEL
ncbi:MAG: UBP-type zinc finger domain-containing protein [Actinomycetota bacterium]|nr:UBP-type zinc finger domain-containing protein [Actinomycetota bacterium]